MRAVNDNPFAGTLRHNGDGAVILTVHQIFNIRQRGEFPDIPDTRTGDPMSWFKLDISDDAYNLLHSAYLTQKSNGATPSKGDVAVRLISEGMFRLEKSPKSVEPIRVPPPGLRTVQIDKRVHSSFFAKLDTFTANKNFHSRHFASRYCLYLVLGLSTD